MDGWVDGTWDASAPFPRFDLRLCSPGRPWRGGVSTLRRDATRRGHGPPTAAQLTVPSDAPHRPPARHRPGKPDSLSILPHRALWSPAPPPSPPTTTLMMSLKSLHLKTLHSRNRKSRLRLSPGPPARVGCAPRLASAARRPANPILPPELGRLHRHMLAGIRGGVVWRRGGDGSALKSGFLIEWLLFASFFFAGRGTCPPPRCSWGLDEADISTDIGEHGTRGRGRLVGLPCGLLLPAARCPCGSR